MKLNEIASGNVWVIISEEDYEATMVHGIFKSEAEAKKALNDPKNAESKWQFRDYKIVKVPMNSYSEYDAWDAK